MLRNRADAAMCECGRVVGALPTVIRALRESLSHSSISHLRLATISCSSASTVADAAELAWVAIICRLFNISAHRRLASAIYASHVAMSLSPSAHAS